MSRRRATGPGAPQQRRSSIRRPAARPAAGGQDQHRDATHRVDVGALERPLRTFKRWGDNGSLSRVPRVRVGLGNAAVSRGRGFTALKQTFRGSWPFARIRMEPGKFRCVLDANRGSPRSARPLELRSSTAIGKAARPAADGSRVGDGSRGTGCPMTPQYHLQTRLQRRRPSGDCPCECHRNASDKSLGLLIPYASIYPASEAFLRSRVDAERCSARAQLSAG